jgi:hypothetical protein
VAQLSHLGEKRLNPVDQAYPPLPIGSSDRPPFPLIQIDPKKTQKPEKPEPTKKWVIPKKLNLSPTAPAPLNGARNPANG